MFCYVVHLKCLYVVLTAWGTSRDGEGAKKHAENCESLSFKIVTVEVYKSLTASLSFFIHLPHVAAWKPRWDQRQAGGNEEQLQGAAEETGGESVRVFVIYLCKSSMKIKDHYLCISSQDVVRPSVCPTCICFVVASLIFFLLSCGFTCSVHVWCGLFASSLWICALLWSWPVFGHQGGDG